jgi:NADPH2:quinone reductase
MLGCSALCKLNDVLHFSIAGLDTSYTNWMETVEERDAYAREAYRLVSNGDVKIHIFKEYPFTADGVRQAQLDLVRGKSAGKVIIRVAV